MTNSYPAYVARDNNSTGTVKVDGAGSQFLVGSFLALGTVTNSAANLSMTNGGSIQDTTSTVASATGSVVTATVDGIGSTWNNSANLYVGGSGEGTITVSHGGTLSTGTSIDGLGSQIDAYGPAGSTSATVTVTDAGSTWTNTDALRIGFGGSGLLQIMAAAPSRTPTPRLAALATERRRHRRGLAVDMHRPDGDRRRYPLWRRRHGPFDHCRWRTQSP